MGTFRQASVLSVGVAAALLLAACGETTSNQAAASPKPVIVGLITKTDANPFFVKMRQGAEREAAAKGAVLMTGAGKDTSDAAGEVTALENMVSAGAKAILITPDSAGVTAAVRKARSQGVRQRLVLFEDQTVGSHRSVGRLLIARSLSAALGRE